MELEVMTPVPAMDFDFNGARSSSPYLSAPSTPKRFGNYFISLSAPSSPTRMSELYGEFEHSPLSNEYSAAIPELIVNGEDDFAFDFSVDLEKNSLSADDLFDGGKIKPLKPPPRLQQVSDVVKSPKRSIFTSNSGGRQGKTEAFSSNSCGRATRSLSPFRIPEENENDPKPSFSATDSTLSSSSSTKIGSRRWRLKDFLLFRNASEGRASDKDPLKKYSNLSKKQDDSKNSSFRSIDGSFSASRSKKKGQISAHELHYTANRAASEDMKKKTFLPYRQGILGRLAFNPAANALSNGFGTFTR